MAVAERNVVGVLVLYTLKGRQWMIPLDLPFGSTAGDAIEKSRVSRRFPEIGEKPELACFGRRVAWDTCLQDNDRLDILRPLVTDPKESRQIRAKVQRNGPPQS